MNELKKNLINQALANYERIYPCSMKNNLFDCFTTEGDQVVFWFNTEDHSTHVLTASVNC